MLINEHLFMTLVLTCRQSQFVSTTCVLRQIKMKLSVVTYHLPKLVPTWSLMLCGPHVGGVTNHSSATAVVLTFSLCYF